MSLRKTIKRIRASAVPGNEETAKVKIVLQILADLGWDPYSEEVLYEHPVGGKLKGGRVDVALAGPRGGCVALIEAKSPPIDLSGHVGQVLGYAFHERVGVCVLTTGTEWWLYLPREAGPPDERRFAQLRLLHDPVEQLLDDFKAFLGRQNLLDGRAEGRARRVLKARREANRLNVEAPRVWQAMLTAPDEDLAELLNKRVYEEVGLRLTPNQISAVLNGAAVPPAEVPGSDQGAAPSRPDASHDPAPPVASVPADQPPTPKPAAPPNADKPPRRITRKPTAVILCGRHQAIKHNYEILLAVAEMLYRRHGQDYFERVLGQHKGKRPLIHRDPNKFISCKPVGSSGYYLNVNYNAVTFRKISDRLLLRFRYSPDDLVVKYD